MARKPVHDALARLAEAEDQFLRSEFLAPVVEGGRVDVRIEGVVCRLRVTPADFRGFGVFRPLSHAQASLVRPASLSQRRQYLQLFPRVQLVAIAVEQRATFAVPANPADGRFQIQGAVELRLAEDVNPFDTVAARFDGTHFWFDEIDPRSDPAAAPYLRQALAQMREPQALDRPGLVPGQRLAYLLNYRARVEQMVQDERTRAERTLREALEHAGATLRDFVEHSGEYRVSFEVDGRRHTSVVRKGDLTVHTAGICLSGQDRNFDLHSLVGVLREAASDGR